MSKKMGTLRLEPKMLKLALQLPEDIDIEHIERGFDGRLFFTVVLSGDSLPVDVPEEGCPIPRMSAFFVRDEADGTVAWQFPDYRPRPIVRGSE